MSTPYALHDEIAQAMANSGAHSRQPRHGWLDIIRDSRLRAVAWDPHEGLFVFLADDNTFICVAYGHDADDRSLEEQLQDVDKGLDAWSLTRSYEDGQQIALVYHEGKWHAMCESSIPVPDARYV